MLLAPTDNSDNGNSLGGNLDKGNRESSNREDSPLEVSNNQLHFRPLRCLCPPRRGLGPPAEADPGGGGALKFVGASHAQDLNYASCMRRHGVADFPDPNTDGVFSLINIDPNTSQYRGAENACQKVLPKVNPPSPAEQAKFVQKALAFAQCMRSHGEPAFRDPSITNDGISFSLSGLDPSAPQFQRAQQACRKLAPFAGGGPLAP